MMAPSTPPRTSSPLNPTTPPQNTRIRTAPSPSLSRPPSATVTTPESRYPAYRNLTSPTPAAAPHLPSTPLRNQLLSRERAPTPSIIHRAINTALPATPPQRYSRRLPTSASAEELELSQLPYRDDTHRGSPFHDRHSVVLDTDTVEDLEDDWSPSGGKQRTADGYRFAGMKDVEYGRELELGAELGAPVFISEKRRSLYPAPVSSIGQNVAPIEEAESTPPLRDEPPPIRPRFRRLLALSTWRDIVFLFVPGLLLSGASALVPPFMSLIIGDTFEILAQYPLATRSATPEQRHDLLEGIRYQTILLAAAGLFAIVTNYAGAVVWAWHGEAVAAHLRRLVFEGVQVKRMEWFDMGMGMRPDEEEEEEAVGAGGLMAKFTKETDDVRLACAQSMGNFVQYFGSFALCFALAMVKAPVLALVTLSTIPLVVLVQIVTQVMLGPMYAAERRGFAEASTDVERCTNAISTVKAHNAQSAEKTRFDGMIQRVSKALVKQAIVWGASISLTDFLLLATFVSGFWYGADMVRKGKIGSGDVMTVFWACLLASSYLQQAVPTLTFITKGKMSMASMLTVIQDVKRKDRPMSISNPFSPAGTPTEPGFRPHSLVRANPTREGKIRPVKCIGEFNLRNVSFAYPSRPDVQVLRDITLFLPPSETTFIVGGSGSGKSTIAQLLLRLYDPDGGEISLDEQPFAYLDEAFTKENIAAVQQGCILFDMSVHDNVALGLAGSGGARRPQDVTRDEVVEACRMAMMHEFISGLPDGYETRLGTSGSSLSGGQRQRLAIARARIRDPSILILDEATSALDASSRVQVFENIKTWRRNRTTIVITHDLSQILPDDFVYVMKNGIVAEQGFRSDLMRKTPGLGEQWGVFAELAAEQSIEPVPLKWEETADGYEELQELQGPAWPGSVRPTTPSFAMRPQSLAYFDILDEYSRGGRNSVMPDAAGRPLSMAQKRLSWGPVELNAKPSRSSLAPASAYSRPTSALSHRPQHRISRQISFEGSPYVVTASPGAASRTSFDARHDYRQRTLSQNLDDDMKAHSQLAIYTVPHSPTAAQTPGQSVVVTDEEKGPLPGIFFIIRTAIPLMPHRWLFFIGLIGALGHGIATPIWANFLSRLMQILAGGGTDPMLTTYALIVLAICVGQAVCNYTQEYALWAVAAHWTGAVRSTAYERVLAQDKGWFDRPGNAPAVLVQNLIKDADDMRTAISQIAGKIVVFASMVLVGIIWAVSAHWRLTLVGLAIAPVFAGVVVVNEMLVGRAEMRNKDRRDEVAKLFHESVANIRGIRAMSLESTFSAKFMAEAQRAQWTGKRAGLFMGIGIAASACMPLVAMALLNWVGTQFILSNLLDYAQMLSVYNLILFSLTFGSQALDFIPMMAKVKVAARDFSRLYKLPLETSESTGALRYPITGHVQFDNVHFAYPTRPDTSVLSGVSFRLSPGECVAIVGPSGSGKSTIAALLQRLYEPTCAASFSSLAVSARRDPGRIRMDKHDLASADVKWLRNHIAVVSQTANLFDASVAENISYGSDVPIGEVHRAAKAANIHDFILSLPQGYDTNLGENASLISGGQAQRLQIARALVRRSTILILDEATSALDVENQRAILDTIVKIKEMRTTIFITHSVEAMKRCDRVICLDEGRVAEDGGYEELVRKNGVFAQLMRMGEWE